MLAAHNLLLTSITATPAPPASFITRQASTGYLMRNGERFRFGGTNIAQLGETAANSAYGATVDGGGYHISSHSEIDATLNSAEALGFTVVRGYGTLHSVGRATSVQPTLGTFSSTNMDSADYLMQQCTLRDLRVIFTLVDNYSPMGRYWYCTENGVTPDAGASQFYSNTTIINSFKAFISWILNRTNPYTGIMYKNDPMILCWETGNEMKTNGVWSGTEVAWTENIAQHIKVTEGAQQLVMDGHCIEEDAGQFGLEHVDCYTSHAYEDAAAPNILMDTVAGPLKTTYRKVHIVGEETWTGQNQSHATLNWTLTEMLSRFEAAPQHDGDAIWDLLAPLTNWGDGFTLHSPADSSNAFVSQAEMAIRGQQLLDHATKMPTVTAIYVAETAASGVTASRTRSVTFGSAFWVPKENDCVVLFIASTSVQAITTPAGWTNVLGGNTLVASDAHTIGAVYHFVTSGEAAAGTVTYSATNVYNVAVDGATSGLVLRGVDTVTTIDSTGTAFSSVDTASPHSLPGLTGANLSNDSLVISGISRHFGTGGWNAPIGWGALGAQSATQEVAAFSRNLLTTAGVDIAATTITGSADEYASITIAFLSPLFIDGGNVSSTSADTVDGGDFASTATDTIDGGSL